MSRECYNMPTQTTRGAMQSITIHDVVDYLNDIHSKSPMAVGDLLNMRTCCGYRLRKDPRIRPVCVPGPYGTPTIGLLEVINGMFAETGTRIAATYARPAFQVQEASCHPEA